MPLWHIWGQPNNINNNNINGIWNHIVGRLLYPFFFFPFNTKFVKSITIVAYSSSPIPIVQMRKLRLRKSNLEKAQSQGRSSDNQGNPKLLSVASVNYHLLAATTAPLCGEDQLLLFLSSQQDYFSEKDQLNHLPTAFFFFPQKPLLILGSKIKSSFFPQLIPSCAIDRKLLQLCWQLPQREISSISGDSFALSYRACL